MTMPKLFKVGNPALRPQFTNSVELGYKNNWEKGSLYSAAYHRFADGTITRISSTVAEVPSFMLYIPKRKQKF
jgi:outer membrane receptor protein involved in Fe transport